MANGISATTQVDYPFHFDGRGRTASTAQDEHIRDLIEQVLFTSPGERVNRPDVRQRAAAAGLRAEQRELAAATQFLVQGALQQWLGDLIAVEAVAVDSRRLGAAGERCSTSCAARSSGRWRSLSGEGQERSMIYFCCDEKRRKAVEAKPGLNGIDFLEVLDSEALPLDQRQRTLFVHFLKAAGLPALKPENIRIEGGERVRDVAATNGHGGRRRCRRCWS